MEIKDFIQNFYNQFDDTELSEFKPGTKFRDLEEWSSLSALSIMAMIDEEYDVQLKADEMRKTNTIQDLFDLVNAKSNNV